MLNTGLKKNKISSAILAAVKQAFANMAFINVEKINKYHGNVPYKPIIYIDILKPFTGCIALFLSYTGKKNILENIYGRAFNELNASEIDDALLEILNVLGGCFLSHAYGKRIKYNVGIPKILFEKSDIKMQGKKKLHYYFDAEGSIFKVMIAY